MRVRMRRSSASALSPACAHTLSHLALPHLADLLARLDAEAPDRADEYSLNPPHERALARLLGLRGEDGALPFAARQAQADGIAVADQAWGLLTPVHWQVGREHVSLVDPGMLELDVAESKALFGVEAVEIRRRRRRDTRHGPRRD